MKARLSSTITYIIGSMVGVLAFLYPFFLPHLVSNTPIGSARTAEMPLLLTALLGLSLLLLLFEVQGQAMDTKLIALLGVLVAINSALRFIEIAIPGPGGFSLIFFLIIMTGYVYGGRVGFLMGALTLLVSAMVTGGIGPWLPGQMLTAGWMGMSSPLMHSLTRLLKLKGKFGEVLLLAFFGAFWGLLYGGIMNLWSWPYITGPAGQSWQAGIGIMESLRRYAAYYLVTSLIWDLMRSIGSFIILLIFARPTLSALQRFQRRFTFDYSNIYKDEIKSTGSMQTANSSSRRSYIPPERIVG